MTDAIDALCELLREAGAKVTLDLGASNRHPCTCCAAPGPHALVGIGTYPNGDPIRRPACLRCRVLLHLCGCEPDDRQLQALAAYELARVNGGAPTAETLRAAIEKGARP